MWRSAAQVRAQRSAVATRGAQVVVERGAVELDAHLVHLGLRMRAELEALFRDDRDLAGLLDEAAAELLELRRRGRTAGQEPKLTLT